MACGSDEGFETRLVEFEVVLETHQFICHYVLSIFGPCPISGDFLNSSCVKLVSYLLLGILAITATTSQLQDSTENAQVKSEELKSIKEHQLLFRVGHR